MFAKLYVHRNKGWLRLLLCLVAVAVLCAAGAMAAGDETVVEDYYSSYDGDGNLLNTIATSSGGVGTPKITIKDNSKSKLTKVYDGGKTTKLTKDDFTLSFEGGSETINSQYSIKTVTTVYNSENVNGANKITATITLEPTLEVSPMDIGGASITPKSISSATVADIPDKTTTSGTEVKPLVSVKDGNKSLTKDKDYTVSYKNNKLTASGTGTVVITGKGNYTGTLEKTFKITIRGGSSSGSSSSGGSGGSSGTLLSFDGAFIPNQRYTGLPIEPELDFINNDTGLVKDIDYSVDYYDNIEVGEATVVITGIGNYSGNRIQTFRIIPQDTPERKLTVTSKTKKYSKVYDGTKTANLSLSNFVLSNIAEDDTDKVSIAKVTAIFDNANAGADHVVTVKLGIKSDSDNYNYIADDLEIEGAIYPLNVLSYYVRAYGIEDQVYTGSEITPDVKLTYNNSELEFNKDYTVEYTNNIEIGTATVTIKGIGNFNKEGKTTFEIIPEDEPIPDDGRPTPTPTPRMTTYPGPLQPVVTATPTPAPTPQPGSGTPTPIPAPTPTPTPQPGGGGGTQTPTPTPTPTAQPGPGGGGTRTVAPTPTPIPGTAINATNFPDANFRKYLQDYMDTNGDGFLSLTEISSTTSLDVSNSSIASLEGIELFTNLTTLDCSYNNLTSLDVSGLKKLQTLRCNNNKLTSLNTSGNGLLSLLNCKTNSLTALNISGNIRLKKLYANGNKFTKLNISASPVLVDTVNEGTRSTMSTYRIYTLDDTGYLSCDTGVTVSTTPEPDLILPTSLTTIGEEAFAGGAFRYVKLSTKVKTIGKRAFADCPNLTDIYIPKTVTSIASDAFEGIGGNLTIHGVSGSTAQTYASSHGYTFTTK